MFFPTLYMEKILDVRSKCLQASSTRTKICQINPSMFPVQLQLSNEQTAQALFDSNYPFIQNLSLYIHRLTSSSS